MCEGFEVGKVVCGIKELQEDQYTQSIVIKGKSNTKRASLFETLEPVLKIFVFY